eukprot:TRINITY_DN4319_c0_g1_i1.p1 TRINITY_DN4319_c0_g1~~TRINITY_DN4319_c0_g1_i1.p1  ORF type:complete len:134 (+),score=22.98 TRINITY_DN4319_c0_g1_i1:39-404(+)
MNRTQTPVEKAVHYQDDGKMHFEKRYGEQDSDQEEDLDDSYVGDEDLEITEPVYDEVITQKFNLEKYQHKPKTEHGLYTTSNNAYGSRAPTAWEMPEKYKPKGYAFTKSFQGGFARSSGLR